MKRRVLDALTLTSVVLTAFLLLRAGWLLAATTETPRQAELRAPDDPYGTRSAMRYRRCQENHWRACILQR